MDETKEELELYKDLYYSCKDKLLQEREILKEILEISYRIRWSPDERKVWLKVENLVKTFN